MLQWETRKILQPKYGASHNFRIGKNLKDGVSVVPPDISEGSLLWKGKGHGLFRLAVGIPAKAGLPSVLL